MSKLAEALRRRFKTPRDAIAALGLDPNLLAMDAKFLHGASNMNRLTSRRAIVAHGAISAFLRPVLAFDAKFDATSVLGGINARNYKASIPVLVERIKRATAGKLAFDADPEDLRAVLESLVQKDDDDDDEINAASPGLNDADTQQPLSRDALRRRLKSDRSRRAFDEMSDEDVQAFIAAYLDGGDGPDVGQDEPPDFPGKPKTGGAMVPLAADAASRSFARMFPAAHSVRVLPSDNLRHATARIDSKAAASFAAMFPGAGKARVL